MGKKVSLTRNLPNSHPHNHHLPSGVPGVASPEFRKHDPLAKGVIHCENESEITSQDLKCTGWASTRSIRVGLGTQWEIIACFYQVLSLVPKQLLSVSGYWPYRSCEVKMDCDTEIYAEPTISSPRLKSRPISGELITVFCSFRLNVTVW